MWMAYKLPKDLMLLDKPVRAAQANLIMVRDAQDRVVAIRRLLGSMHSARSHIHLNMTYMMMVHLHVHPAIRTAAQPAAAWLNGLVPFYRVSGLAQIKMSLQTLL